MKPFLSILSIALLAVFVAFVFVKNSSWIMELSIPREKSPSESNLNYVHVPEVVVNIAGQRGDVYCKLGLTLAVYEKEVEKLSDSGHMTLIEDTIIGIVSSYSYSGLGSVEGKLRLKDHVLQAINNRIGGAFVKDVCFRGIIFQ